MKERGFSPKRGTRFQVFSGICLERVWNAVGTRLERERTVRLFLSSTVFDKIIVQYILYSIMSFLHGVKKCQDQLTRHGHSHYAS